MNIVSSLRVGVTARRPIVTPARWGRRAFILVLVGFGLVAVPDTAAADAVTDWNVTLIEAQTIAKIPGPVGVRHGAIVAAAVFDAVNGIRPRYGSIHVQPDAPRYASREAAAASAAHDALVSLYPDQQALFDARLAASMATLAGDDRSINAGLDWGKAVAAGILSWRADDGSATILPPYVIGTAPGDWQPTPPAFVTTPAFRQVGVTAPFGLRFLSQFRPAGPPPLTSARYAADFNEVMEFGRLTSTTRSLYQTQTAFFWAGASDSPVAFWNRVALQLLARHHASLGSEARVFALLNMAMSDAGGAIWEAKAFFDRWRPVTAIQRAESDGNPATSQDTTWLPLIVTPPFQEYPSGHAGVSGAGAGLLASFFGERTTFTVTAATPPGQVRRFVRFSDALADVADARTFAGIHFRFASVDASRTGRQIARYIRRTMLRPLGHGDRRRP